MLAETRSFTCNAFLDTSGVMRKAQIRREEGDWKEFNVENTSLDHYQDNYIVPMLPVDFHRHGMGKQDFSAFLSLDLPKVNEEAKNRGVLCILSVSLPQHNLNEFLAFMQRYAVMRQEGALPYLIGISLEGPLLASFGGTPQQGCWAPTKAEWEKLARCAEFGLQYIVISPDATLPGAYLTSKFGPHHPTMEWISTVLLEAGIRLALGHFQRSDPAASARSISSLLKIAQKYGNQRSSVKVITDHVFNDMPLKFRHAWRTPEEKKLRDQQISSLQLEQWNMGNLETMLGEVPAALLRAASEGLLMLCINFDGEHVDLAVCRRVVELVGSKSIVAITDSTNINTIGEQPLQRKDGVNLWYQENGKVAVGMSSMDRQMENLRLLGINERAIWDMVAFVPAQILKIKPVYDVNNWPLICSYVSGQGQRNVIAS